MIKKLINNIVIEVRQIRNIRGTSLYRFSEKKQSDPVKKDNYMNKGVDQKKQVKIDEKYKIKSAALYDKYLQSRQKPFISLDEYQINYCWILQRIPIFLPHTKQFFSYYKNRYQLAKKTGYIVPLPKQLIIEQGDYLFEQYQKTNPENIPSHQTIINGQTTFYRQNARYWRYTDPHITNDKSVQAYSSDNVFLIVQNNKGEWIFPERPITQKQTNEEFAKNFSAQLFAGQAYPNLYFQERKPIYSTRQQIQNMEKGIGIKTFYFRGYTMSGIPKFPTTNFKDYKWVPKPHLHKFFTPQYSKKVVRLAKFYF